MEDIDKIRLELLERANNFLVESEYKAHDLAQELDDLWTNHFQAEEEEQLDLDNDDLKESGLEDASGTLSEMGWALEIAAGEINDHITGESSGY